MTAPTFPRETPDALACARDHLAICTASPSHLIWTATGDAAGSLCPAAGGYWRLTLRGAPKPRNRWQAHRIVWALHHGAWPRLHLDHINGNPADNRPENLREATPAENSRNLVRLTSANRSGFPGVSHHVKGGWQAIVRVNGANHYAGHYATKEAAFVAAYEAKERLHPDAIGFLAAWRPTYEACRLRAATLAAFGEVRPSIFGDASAEARA